MKYIMMNFFKTIHIRLIKKLVKLTKQLNLIKVSRQLKKNYEQLLINYLYNNNIDLFKDIHNLEEFSQSTTIWVCWLQGHENAPPLVTKCISQLKKYNKNVVILDLNNYQNHIQLPQVILDKFKQKKITHTHFSDILRFALLAEHGGLWIDATYLTSKPLPIELWNNDFFTLSSQKKIFKNWIPQGQWSGNFIKFQKGDPTPRIIYNMFIQYWTDNNYLIDYFLIDYIIRVNYKNNPYFKTQIDKNKHLGDHIFLLAEIISEQCSLEKDILLNQDTIKIYKLSHRFSLNIADVHGSYYEKFILNREP